LQQSTLLTFQKPIHVHCWRFVESNIYARTLYTKRTAWMKFKVLLQ
jgi:hypothetical protein